MRHRAILRYAVARLHRNVRDAAVAKAIERQYNVSPRTSYRFVAKAWEYIERNRKPLQPFNIMRMEAIFEQHRIMAIRAAKAAQARTETVNGAFADADFARLTDSVAKNLVAADKAADKLAKIYGVYAPEKHAHLHGHVGRIAVNLDALSVEQLSELERICEQAALPPAPEK